MVGDKFGVKRGLIVIAFDYPPSFGDPSTKDGMAKRTYMVRQHAEDDWRVDAGLGGEFSFSSWNNPHSSVVSLVEKMAARNIEVVVE